MEYIYADNAATTAVSDEVLKEMLPYFKEQYGNPSSIYRIGQSNYKAVDASRAKVAKAIGANKDEIYFTSGGSEADNWAIKGIALALKAKGKNHIITSKFEHHAVLHTVEELAKYGFEITYLDVYEDGMVRVEDVKNAIKDTTALVSIMYANNEIGTIQPIKEIGAVCKEKKVLFHTDAVQAIGNVEIDVKDQNIDMLSMSAHKFHGPKGVGCLYIRKGVVLKTLIHGGAQEKSKRAGTENVPGIVGMATAIEIATSNIPARQKRLSEMRDYVIEHALKIDRSRLNGNRTHRLPGTVNMCFEGVEGESLLLMLDLKGVAASSGSACTSGSLDPSHVLLAIGLPHEIAHGSLRLSFGDNNTMEDAKYITEILPGIIEKLRAMSPVWEKIQKGQKVY